MKLQLKGYVDAGNCTTFAPRVNPYPDGTVLSHMYGFLRHLFRLHFPLLHDEISPDVPCNPSRVIEEHVTVLGAHPFLFFNAYTSKSSGHDPKSTFCNSRYTNC